MNRRNFLQTVAALVVVGGLSRAQAAREPVGEIGRWESFRFIETPKFDPTREYGYSCQNWTVREAVDDARYFLPKGTPFEVRETIGFNYGHELVAWYYSPTFKRIRRKGLFNGKQLDKVGGYWLRYRGWA